MMTVKRLPIVLLLILILAGCTPLTRTEQGNVTDFITLEEGLSLGQTFVARYDGLQRIAFYLEPEIPGKGTISLNLRSAPDESANLRSATLPLERVTSPGYYFFEFAPIEQSNGIYYYAFIRMLGNGSVKVGTTDGASYINGAAYLRHAPLDAQAAFLLGYNRRLAIYGLLLEGLVWLAWLAAGIFLYIIPGWALLSALWPNWGHLHWAEKLGLAGGVSLAIYPLLLLWTDLIGLHLGSLYAWLPALIGIAVILWRNWENILTLPANIRSQWPSPPRTLFQFPWVDFTILVVIGLIIATRFWVIRGLEAPMWGDGYHHTMITQLLVDNGGLFKTWEPYVPYTTMSVHFGFHAAAATFAWISGYPATMATLIAGQIINCLAIIALLPLALRFSARNLWAGAGTLLVAGLLSQVPAIYVNWGRYAQLAGLAVLPAAIWLTWDLLDSQRSKTTISAEPSVSQTLRSPTTWLQLFLTGVIITGMTLNYYRMPFFYAAFILAWMIGWGLPRWKLNIDRWSIVFLQLLLLALIASLFFLPWYTHLTSGNLGALVETGSVGKARLNGLLNSLQNWIAIENYLPRVLILAVITALIWSLVKRQWWVPSLVLWIAILNGYIFGSLINLPAANMLQTFAIIITIYFPAGLICGWLIGEIANLFIHKGRLAGLLTITIGFFIVALWGALKTRAVGAPETYALVTRPDSRAMSWINKNLPGETLILVEGFRIYAGTSVVGSDGGWWLPLLSMRQNTLPPQYALLNELPSPQDYSKSIVDLYAGLESSPPSSPEALSLFCDHGISHIFIGQGQGKTGFGAVELFSPEDLRDISYFEEIYHQDRVSIFTLNPTICQEDPSQ